VSTIYAMQRANRDWFAFESDGRLCVPVFGSRWAAMLARTRNMGMLLFHPAEIDGRALGELESTPGSEVCFWLIGDPSAKLNRGSRLGHAELSRLVSEAAEHPRGRGGVLGL
jgi:hypothetical protein